MCKHYDSLKLIILESIPDKHKKENSMVGREKAQVYGALWTARAMTEVSTTFYYFLPPYNQDRSNERNKS